MKKTTTSFIAAAVAALFASPLSAGILNITSGPTFTPSASFTDNSITADSTVGGGFIHVGGTATVKPAGSDVATVTLDGNYSGGTGEKFSVAYDFTADSHGSGSISYKLSVTAMVAGSPVTFKSTGTIAPGLHEYSGTTSSVPFPIASMGTYSAKLELDFPAQPVLATAAGNSVDLNVGQIDFQLDTQAVTVNPPSQPENLSTRGDVGTAADVLIGGFIITGNDSKLVVLRAVAPMLKGMAITGTLADPVLELHDSSGAVIASNDNWMSNSAADRKVLTDNHLAPTQPKDPALVQTLAPGKYTAIVHGANNTTGLSLVEIYDLDKGMTDSELGNISTRGNVGISDNVMIAGFIVGGNTGFSATIVRGIGPSLAGGDITNPLADPTLELHNADGDVIDSNDNWQDNPNMQTISDDGFAPSDPKESALYDILQPGQYTAVLGGANSTTGVGLVEVYNDRTNSSTSR